MKWQEPFLVSIVMIVHAMSLVCKEKSTAIFESFEAHRLHIRPR